MCCCSSIESADVMMRSSADDPFFRFFNSLLETKTKTFLMKKEKRTGRSFSLHTDVFLEKNHCRNTYVYIRRRVLIFDFLYTVFSTRWCSSIVAIDVAAVLARRRRDDDDDAFCPDVRDFRVLGGTVACVPVGDGCDCDCFFPAR